MKKLALLFVLISAVAGVTWAQTDPGAFRNRHVQTDTVKSFDGNGLPEFPNGLTSDNKTRIGDISAANTSTLNVEAAPAVGTSVFRVKDSTAGSSSGFPGFAEEIDSANTNLGSALTQWKVAGSEVARLGVDGRFGIGTATPAYAIDVVGSINAATSLCINADCKSAWPVASTSIGGPVVGGTAGSVLYVDGSANLAQDNANLYWDGTNHFLGISTNAPMSALTFGHGALDTGMTFYTTDDQVTNYSRVEFRDYSHNANIFSIFGQHGGSAPVPDILLETQAASSGVRMWLKGNEDNISWDAPASSSSSPLSFIFDGGRSFRLESTMTSLSNVPQFHFIDTASFSPTSGTSTGIKLETTWRPSSGNNDYIGLDLRTYLEQTGSASGNYTMFRVQPQDAAILGTSSYLATFGLDSNPKEFVIKPNGTVGFLESGSTPTKYTFVHAGDQSADLTLTLPVNAGSSGQVLSTNGSGVLSWAVTGSASFFSPGTVAQVTQVVTTADVACGLNNTYFNLYNAKNVTHYIIWINCNGLGTDPAIGGTTSSEADINLGDGDAAVATAIQLASNFAGDFSAAVIGNTVTITNGADGTAYGASTPATDGAVPTGFAITTPVPGFDTDPTDPCTAGQLRYDAHFHYDCIATNTWGRVPIHTW